MPTIKIPTYDVIVIGGGSAGFSAASSARATGASVCIVETEKLGGECPHWACVPTKAMLRAAKMYYDIRMNAGRFGITAKKVTFNLPAVMARKDAVVRVITGSDRRLAQVAKDDGIDVVHGRAHFLSKNMIAIGTRKLKAKAFVVATGSVDYMPPIHGIEDVPVLTSRSVTTLKKLPSSIVIVGGGPVGCEFATFFAMCGVDVMLINDAPHILPREDAEVAATVHESFMHLGVTVVHGAKVLSAKRQGKRIRLTYQAGHAPRRTFDVDSLMMAAGRRPNMVPGLDPDAKNVFFAGDVTGEMMFTHVAHHEGVVAGWNAANLKKTRRRKQLRVVPRVTFTMPEVASVGMTAEAAVAAGHAIALRRFPIGALGRAVIDGKREGMLKVVLDKRSGHILGASMAGERAGEVIHELALAMYAGIPFDDVASMIHAYPTYSECIPGAQ